MDDWSTRLTGTLEPILMERDPRPRLSVYHDMPSAIFCYPPKDEFDLRAGLRMLRTRLEQAGKRVTVISLADCMDQALAAELPIADLVAAERSAGIDAAIDTVHEVLSQYQPLHELVVRALPAQADPLIDLIFLTRAGALFPSYRCSSLLEQLKGLLPAPTVLFYPGVLEGPAGLKFMGVLDPEHNYRVKIF